MSKKLLTLCFTTLPFTVLADHASIGLGVGLASPISTESGITLPEGMISTGFRSEYIKFDEYSDAKLQDLRAEDAEADLHSVESLWSLSISAAYGLTDDLTLGIRVPFIIRHDIREPEHDFVGPGAPVESLGNVEGIGDTTFYSQYRFFKNEGTNISALLGIKAPTGKTIRSTLHDGKVEILDAEFQPGSGSWDGILGLAFTQKIDALSITASSVYTIASEGTQDTDLGDIFSYNFALSYRLLGQKGVSYEAPKFALDTIIEFNGEWRDKEQNSNVKDNNSGGNIAYISPGLRFIAGNNVSVGASFGIPIVQNTNGNQVEPDYRVISSINFSF